MAPLQQHTRRSAAGMLGHMVAGLALALGSTALVGPSLRVASAREAVPPSTPAMAEGGGSDSPAAQALWDPLGALAAT